MKITITNNKLVPFEKIAKVENLIHGRKSCGQ